MENAISVSRPDPSMVMNAGAPPAVSGTYRIYEREKEKADGKFLALPEVVHITHRPDFIGLEILNEETGAVRRLEYPLNGAPCWDEQRQAVKYTRAEGGAYVAYFVRPSENSALPARVSYRIIWEIDEQGRIHEIYENFDAGVNRLNSSLGHHRVLVPLKSD